MFTEPDAMNKNATVLDRNHFDPNIQNVEALRGDLKKSIDESRYL